ncbi:MAG: hypothetical protein ACR2PX_15025 [Endozoicomonas sp.]|uniref:hypothetical protein n=1 Tax=Endozoicomonas sp. TaxID=1892382 RepID=UPI003D9B57D5
MFWNKLPAYHSLIAPEKQPYGFRDLFYHNKHKRIYINLYGYSNYNTLAHYDWKTNTIAGLKIDTNDELMHLVGWGEDSYGNLIAYTDDVNGKHFGTFNDKGIWKDFADASKKYGSFEFQVGKQDSFTRVKFSLPVSK